MSVFSVLKNADITFYPTEPYTSPRGGVTMVPGSGESVEARVEAKTVNETMPDGTPISTTFHVVYLFDSPSTLNGGVGIRQDDQFLFGDQTLVAMGPAKRHKTAGFELWRVDCTLVT